MKSSDPREQWPISAISTSNGTPKFVKNVSLPWSLQNDVSKATAFGNLMAQGDSDSIGCRILVNDEVKVEKISNEVNAFTSCVLQAA